MCCSATRPTPRSRLGGEESSLYTGLKWSSEVETALKNSLESTIRDLQHHSREIEALPASGVPGQLRTDLSEDIAQIRHRISLPDFHKHAADLSTQLTAIKTRTRNAAIQMADAIKSTVKEAQQDLQRLPEWPELTQEEQSKSLSQLDDLVKPVTNDLSGLKQLLRQAYEIGTSATDFKKHIEQLGKHRRLQRIEDEKAKAKKAGQTKLSRDINIPAAITTTAQLEELIGQLQALRTELATYCAIEVTIKIQP